MGMSRGKSAHPRTMYKEINLNELICHISLGHGRHSGRDFGPAFHTETEERNLHYLLSLIILAHPQLIATAPPSQSGLGLPPTPSMLGKRHQTDDGQRCLIRSLHSL